MLNVVFDSNVLHEEGLSSNDMKILKGLIDRGLVQIHLPSLVAKEFITKKRYGFLEGLDKSKQNLDALDRDIKAINADMLPGLNEVKDIISKYKESIKGDFDKHFKTWLDEFKVSIVDINSTSVEGVFEDYFSGGGVFRKAKSRDDIPDAFISSCILSLLADKGQLIAINKDGVFSRFLSKVPNIRLLTSLEDLFDLEELVVAGVDSEKIDFITSPEFNLAFSTYLQSNPNYLEHSYFDSEGISGLNKISQVIFGAVIELYDYDELQDVQIYDSRFVEGEVYSAKIEFKRAQVINYVTDYGSFLDIDRDAERDASLESMNGDGMCDVSEVVMVGFSGEITVNYSNTENHVVMDDALLSIERRWIPFDVDIKYAEIIKFLA